MAHKHHDQSTGTYQFKQSHDGGVVSVINCDGYLMAEYNSRTGKVSWQRFLPVTQRESIEKWLHQQYPVAAPPKQSAKK